MQYNISPETLVETRHPKVTVDRILQEELTFNDDYCVCANGAQYRKDIHGFLPEIMQKIYDERTIYKKRMLQAKQSFEHATTPAETVALQKDISKFNNIQMARKIQLNSAYGAIGNQYFRYYNLANAEAITLSGQVSIRWIENKMNQYLNKVLKLLTKIMLLLLILILSTLILVLWFKVYSRAERRLLKGLSRSLIRCVRWNLKSILRVLMKRSPTMSTLMNKR